MVRLPDDTSFVARYKKISTSSLPGKIRVTRTRTVWPRYKWQERIKKKRVRFNLANTPTRGKARRIKRKYRRFQSGKGLASTIANLVLAIGSKSINLVLGKKLIDNGVESLPGIVKFGASKIKNKSIQQALDSDIANYVVEEEQNRA